MPINSHVLIRANSQPLCVTLNKNPAAAPTHKPQAIQNAQNLDLVTVCRELGKDGWEDFMRSPSSGRSTARRRWQTVLPSITACSRATSTAKLRRSYGLERARRGWSPRVAQPALWGALVGRARRLAAWRISARVGGFAPHEHSRVGGFASEALPHTGTPAQTGTTLPGLEALPRAGTLAPTGTTPPVLEALPHTLTPASPSYALPKSAAPGPRPPPKGC
jgi:hypothetical protein